MNNQKTSKEVNYTNQGKPGQQCRDCVNFEPRDEESGNCLGHRVAASGNCNNFSTK